VLTLTDNAHTAVQTLTSNAGLPDETLTHGGTVEVIGEEHRDLEPVGGLAALLRF